MIMRLFKSRCSNFRAHGIDFQLRSRTIEQIVSSMGKSVLIINGPNLNMLGTRQPDIYGSDTLADIESMCVERGNELGIAIDFRQTNDEGEMVNWIQGARPTHDAIVINAAAYTHTSVALLDALLAVEMLIIEVHLSNIHQRDEFRQHSYVAKAATGMICGLGAQGYSLALDAIASRLETNGGCTA